MKMAGTMCPNLPRLVLGLQPSEVIFLIFKRDLIAQDWSFVLFFVFFKLGR